MRNPADLIEFLENTISMTEVYQPVITLRLLELGGAAIKDELAHSHA